MHFLSGPFLLLCLGFLAYKAYTKIRKLRILSKSLTVAQFLAELHWNIKNNNLITCIGIDRPDADNFLAVLILLQLLNKTTTPLCIFLTGRPFNPKSPPCVKMPDGTIKFIDEHGNIIIMTAKEFFSNPSNILQKPNFVSDKKFAKILHGIFAGQLRLFLETNGFIEGKHYFIFNGGIPPLAGINSAIHVFEPFMMELDGNNGYTLPTAQEINDKNMIWFNMTPEERETYLEEEYNKYGNNVVMSYMMQFFNFCSSNPEKHIVCYGAGPLTPFYTFPKDIANRVVFFQLMGGVFNGLSNILGGCFNNMVDFPKANQVNLFKNARTVYLTTEVCKWSSLFPTKELLEAIQEYAGFSKLSFSFCKWVKQWNEIKGSPQAMFDVISVLPLNVLFNIYGTMSRVVINIDGPNPKIPTNQVFGNMSFKLEPIRNQGVHKEFQPGNYAFDYNPDNEADKEPFVEAIGVALK